MTPICTGGACSSFYKQSRCHGICRKDKPHDACCEHRVQKEVRRTWYCVFCKDTGIYLPEDQIVKSGAGEIIGHFSGRMEPCSCHLGIEMEEFLG